VPEVPFTDETAELVDEAGDPEVVVPFEAPKAVLVKRLEEPLLESTPPLFDCTPEREELAIVFVCAAPLVVWDPVMRAEECVVVASVAARVVDATEAEPEPGPGHGVNVAGM
jgi:hypothetical protein